MKYLRNFENAAAYSAATIYEPSVSLIDENDGVIFNQVPYLKSLSIQGETNVMNSATYGVTYTPSDTFETGVTWSIVSGSEYATINPNTGVLTALNGASSSEVVIRATSIPNSAVTDNKTLSVTSQVPAVKFTAKQDNSTVGLYRKPSNQTIEYSADGDTWTNMTTSTTITLVNSGDSVYVRGVLSSNNSESNYTWFNMTGNIKASGNINYLWNKDNPNAALKQYCGYYLFSGCTALSDASELELPATALTRECYYQMFGGCTSLTTAPALPATTLDYMCYNGMFKGCTSLTTAPVLPATTFAYAYMCYNAMFSGCISLTTAPVLPATTLSVNCYREMFSGCISLTTAPALPATTLANYCYREMFRGCTSLTTAPELPATTLSENCYENMFRGCTSLTTAPVLPATTLSVNCYREMFSGCISLTTAPELPVKTLAQSCYCGMFSGCTSLTTAPVLPAKTLAQACYNYMFQGCTSLTTAPELPATTLPYTCYQYMFMDCRSLTTAPELPAKTLVDYCYAYMFSGCTSLNYIKCLATNISASNCTYRWVLGVSSSGTFVKDQSMAGWSTNVNGIPEGWTVEDAV